ncbi:hypothetical protein [Jannaschia aquimarina]|uniref:Uncharacterized protein n=1 Tax=Jannaschia aquimarina TaxID=935700 RepID=A0A0D1CQ36_9RHOB|nr:hypothetical protein [Jannaschia aquimarina]KIT16847.1 hypothetical protein jaqu_13440 [Jannaschia aquimarina]SNT13096.1 hypothetical protein SAMN05421775_106103 [Jannaschia aquimarina]
MNPAARMALAVVLAGAVYVAARFGMAAFLDAQACAVGWLPGWWPSWAAFCADDGGVQTARALQVADWHRALPLVLAAATFLAVAYPWRAKRR